MVKLLFVVATVPECTHGQMDAKGASSCYRCLPSITEGQAGIQLARTAKASIRHQFYSQNIAFISQYQSWRVALKIDSTHRY
eukprot:scaffold1525_cov142-Cylindrotheca_fusiformis.AAC.160